MCTDRSTCSSASDAIAARPNVTLSLRGGGDGVTTRPVPTLLASSLSVQTASLSLLTSPLLSLTPPLPSLTPPLRPLTPRMSQTPLSAVWRRSSERHGVPRSGCSSSLVHFQGNEITRHECVRTVAMVTPFQSHKKQKSLVQVLPNFKDRATQNGIKNTTVQDPRRQRLRLLSKLCVLNSS